MSTDPTEKDAQVRRVLNDPGAIVPRLQIPKDEGGGYELISDWQVRALAAAGLLAKPDAEIRERAPMGPVEQAIVLEKFRQYALDRIAEPAVATTGDTPRPLGYMIAGPGADGQPEADWDGKVHTSREDGEWELARCRETYTDWGLYALVPVDVASAGGEENGDGTAATWPEYPGCSPEADDWPCANWQGTGRWCAECGWTRGHHVSTEPAGLSSHPGAQPGEAQR